MTTQSVFHPANQRGHVTFDWLESFHSFSFGNYYDPAKLGFGALRVINDDIIAPSRGFGTHPHRDMEIITIPLKGTVLHRDSLGTEGTINSGEVQMMAAGTGILHSEYNPRDDLELRLFQIWIIPRAAGLTPNYQQMNYEALSGQVRWLVSPLPQHEDMETLRINQDAYIGLIEFHDEAIELKTPLPQLGTYILSVEGEVQVNDQILNTRDAYGHWEGKTTLKAKAGSRALVFHVPNIA